MSYRNLTTKPLNLSLNALLKRSAHIGLGIGAFAPVLALANPTGGQVVSGTATISTPNANGMVIKQSTASAIIDWQQFNIGTGQYVQFLQPSSSSVVLNRVIGGGSSSILGSLTGNGQIFLVNTNGVYFGKGASVDAQGFLASTLDINNADFLSGHYLFNKSGSDAQIVNQGNITAHKGGYVVLAGDYAENDGIIAAQSGHIVLASGTKSTLTLNGNSFVSYAINQATLSKLAGVNNAGDLEANGGTVIMTADVANLLKATVVNNTGLIEAHAISKQGGVIQLTATGGNIQNAGLLDASATTLGQQGGDITLKTDGRTTLTSKSRIIDTGDGANGGNLEVSGSTISVRGTALLGKGGHMLLDPGVLKIVAGSGTSHIGSAGNTTSTGSIGVNFIQNQLNQGDGVTIQATHVVEAVGVTAITATKTAAKGGGGSLTIHATGSDGQIDLGSMDIDITGNFNASANNIALGHIQANDVDVTAGHQLELAGATVKKGAITAPSVLATGNLQFSAPSITTDGYGSGGLDLQAKGTLIVEGAINISSKLTLAGENLSITNAITANSVAAVASNGYAHFRAITAIGGNINISATTTNSNSGLSAGNIRASDGSVSLKVTGAGIRAGAIAAHGNISLTAGGDVLTGEIDTQSGAVNVNAGTHGFTITSGESGNTQIFGEKGVSITAGEIEYTAGGDFKVSGGESGALTVKGVFGNTAEGFSHGLQLRAEKTISLDHSVKTLGSLDISGAGLAYTGKASNFLLSADEGTLNLNAAIGTAAAPVKYGVTLTDVGRDLNVTRSIFTAGSVDMRQIRSSGVASPSEQGVDISAPNAAITLSAGKSLSIVGTNIRIGGSGSSAITLKAGKDLTLAAPGAAPGATPSHSGAISIQAGEADATNATANTAVSLSAGGSLDLTGRSIVIQAGDAGAQANASHGKAIATANAGVSLQAGADMDLSASDSIRILGGEAEAGALGGDKTTVTASAVSGVNLTAAKNLTLDAIHTDMYGGLAGVVAHAGPKGTATASGTAVINIKGGSVAFSGSTLAIHGGTARAGQPSGSNDLDTVKDTAAVDVDITASKNILVHVNDFDISGGYAGAAAGGSGGKFTALATANLNIKAGTSFSFDGNSMRVAGLSPRAAQTIVSTGSDETVSATASDAVNITAGKAIGITGNDFVISAGYGDILAFGLGNGTVVNATARTGVSFTAGTDVSVNMNSLTLGSASRSSLNRPTIFLVGGLGAKVTGTINQDISLTAGGALNLGAAGAEVQVGMGRGFADAGSGSIPVPSGISAGGSYGGAAGTVKLTATSNVNLKAGAGGITITGATIDMQGGSDVGRGFNVVATGNGHASANLQAGINVVTTGAFDAHASGSSTRLNIAGGAGDAASAQVFARSNGYGAAQALASITSGINITAGSVTLTVSGVRSGISLGAGGFAGVGDVVQASGNKHVASLTVNSGVNVTDKGAFKLSAATGDGIDVFGGFAAGAHGSASAQSGGKASAIIDANTVIKAGSVAITTSDGHESISGGKFAGSAARAIAHTGGSANRTVDASVSFVTGGAFTMSGADKVLLVADSSAGAFTLDSNSGGLNAASVVSNGVSISAKSINISAVRVLEAFAGDGGDGAQVVANGGKAGLTINSAIGLKAAGSISLTVAGSSSSPGQLVLIGGGPGFLSSSGLVQGGAGARGVFVEGLHGGNAAMTVNEGLSLNAGGNVNITDIAAGSNQIAIAAGFGLGRNASFVSHSSGTHTVTVPSEVEAGLGGGTATLTGNASVTITTSKALNVDAGSHQIFVNGSSQAGVDAKVSAVASGKATASLTQDIVITAASATLDGGNVVLAGGGDADAASASVLGSHGGIAALNVESALKVTTTGAFNVTAASNLTLAAGAGSHSGIGFVGRGAFVGAQGAGQATFNATGDVVIKSGSVSLTAQQGELLILGGAVDAPDTSVEAIGKGDKAALNVAGGVSITATAGSIALTAQGIPSPSNVANGAIGIFAGSNAGLGNRVEAGAGATASLTADTSVTLTAKKSVTADASGFLSIEAGAAAGAGASVVASGKGAAATVTTTGSVNITGATVNLSGLAVTILGGEHAGDSASVFGSHSGHATLTATATVNVKASGNLNITTPSSGGSIEIDAGSNAHTTLGGSNHGVASVTELTGISLQAGGALNLTAGGEVSIDGGNGHSASMQAQTGANAAFTQDGSVTLKAGTTATINGSFIGLFAGGANRVGGNAFTSAGGTSSSHNIPSANKVGGKLAASVNDAITVTAGQDVDLAASGSVVMVAGGDNQLFVGAERLGSSFVGRHWAGGSANLSLNTNVNITAGRNLNIAAGTGGTGSLQVLGMASGNQANVNGGSGSAVAKLSLIGNAVLTAKNDIVLDVAGDASIVGGSLGNLRADHARGNVTILGSADATMSAGHDVVLDDITGSLTVAGTGVNSSHVGGILADAHADSGFASVTGHADGAIKAGHDIRTVTAIGGDLNVVGGTFVDAVTLGSANSEHATATASGSLTAGNNVTITTTGDLSVLGGFAGSAAVAAGSSLSGTRVATTTARGDIIAKALVTLNIGGVATLAGGNSGAAKASLSGDFFLTGTATLDTGVSIKGSGVTLNVTGNLLVHGGTGDSAKAIGIGEATKATATNSADALISATGNVSIHAGSASFVGGSVGHASVQAFGSDDTATGTMHADVSVTAGKAVSVTADGNIILSGAPGAENSALVLAGLPRGILGSSSFGANSATAAATVTGAVKFTAGTTLSVTAGNNLIVIGGSRGGSSAIVAAGSSHSRNDKATLNIDTSVSLTAKGALTLTATGGNMSFITSPAGPSSTRVFADSVGTNVSATANVDQSVTVSGKTLTLNGNVNTFTGSGFSGSNVVIDTSIKLLQNGHPLTGFHPQLMRTDAIHVAPVETTGVSFGGVQNLTGGTSIAPAAQPAGAIDTSGISLDAPVASSLGTLQLQGLVLNLVTVLGETGAPAVKQGTSYTPSSTGYDSAFPASCTALVLDHADRRCSSGGR